ncbi:cell division protein FtsB [Methylohalomonas lacus]|uniref:Cell division protein FtsB n=1 Tax=Methylohalomonas lacus TaxID=398773 RepID=A0AAE3HM99_9GAMM|nr:cell division protein FtsB [Methylohalomonas lacus]MCS3903764.1 cell division protein FtsB [Methylohalomonas lacus]
MKGLTLLLLLLLCFLQYQLWIGNGSLTEVNHLQQTRAELREQNQRLSERNESLAAEVMDLKHGKEALEERARSELGMIRANETFYQIVDRENLSSIDGD